MREERLTLAEVLESARGAGARLRLSLDRLSTLFPLTAAGIPPGDSQAAEAVDAFQKRFETLQDTLANPVFRAVVAAEFAEAKVQTLRDVLNLMEKLGVIDRVADWDLIRQARNRLAHEYPTRPDRQAAQLNDAWTLAPRLLDTLDRVERVARERGLIP